MLSMTLIMVPFSPNCLPIQQKWYVSAISISLIPFIPIFLDTTDR